MSTAYRVSNSVGGEMTKCNTAREAYYQARRSRARCWRTGQWRNGITDRRPAPPVTKQEGSEMLSRKDLVTITAVFWENVSEVHLYTVRTDRTGAQGFHVRGVNHPSEMDAEAERLRAEGFVMGETITLGQLHKLPVNRGLWAMIEPGVHVLIGQMVDGLEKLCGPLAYARFTDVTCNGAQPTAEQMEVARRAAEVLARQGKEPDIQWQQGVACGDLCI